MRHILSLTCAPQMSFNCQTKSKFVTKMDHANHNRCRTCLEPQENEKAVKIFYNIIRNNDGSIINTSLPILLMECTSVNVSL